MSIGLVMLIFWLAIMGLASRIHELEHPDDDPLDDDSFDD